MSENDPRIDDYINALPAWQREICTTLRRIIHETDDQITETIKRTDRPYFVLDGNVCALLATKDHVNLFVYDPIAPDPFEVVNQGQDNATARSVQIYQGDPIDETGIATLLAGVIANNRAGGWRKLGAS